MHDKYAHDHAAYKTVHHLQLPPLHVGKASCVDMYRPCRGTISRKWLIQQKLKGTRIVSPVPCAHESCHRDAAFRYDPLCQPRADPG